MLNTTYTNTNPVRTDAEKVMNHAESVTINTEKISELSQQLIDEYEFKPADWDAPVFPSISESDFETIVDFFIVGNSINYCFNDLDSGVKYATEYLDIEWAGAFGMWASIKRAMDENIPILDADYLKNINKSELTKIFDSTQNTSMPMIESRVNNLNTLGEMMEGLGGSFVSLFEDNVQIYGKNGIVELLVDSNAFKDERTYNEETIRFDKRAQLAVCMVYGKCLNTEYEFEIIDKDAFTIFADYGIPAGLVSYGVLEYNPPLQNQIESRNMIPENSKVEVEIRASTVIAGELIQKEIYNQSNKEISMVILDYLLWQMRNDEDTIAHITETTAY